MSQDSAVLSDRTMFQRDALANAFLQKWIDEKGKVDYQGIRNDATLQNWWKFLENADLSSFTVKEEFAFWLNAYNLLTIKGIIDELSRNPQWKGNLSLWSKIRFFYLKKFRVARRKLNLHAIENKILRKRFRDPRIHFAINCASASCPMLPSKLFDSDNLEDLLENLTRNFVNDDHHVRYDKENGILWLNPIFKWYRKDFKHVGGVLAFIQRYHESKDIQSLSKEKQVIIRHVKYDWSLNSR